MFPDMKDKKLIFMLDQNSRMTNKQIGRKLRLSEQAVGYRIKRLQKSGIIKKFVTFINTLSIGYQHYKVFTKLQNASKFEEDQIISFLVENNNVRWVASTSGKYDLSFSILAKSATHFYDIYSSIESKFAKFIIEKNIVLNVASPGFTRNWLVEEKNAIKLDYGLSEQITLDHVDKKILKQISQHARQSIVEISRNTQLSVDVIKYRIKKLREKKVISGFTIQLDLQKLGHEYYSVFLNLYNVDRKLENKIVEFAKLHSNVLFVLKIIGNYDMQIEFEVKNHEDLEKNMRAFRQYFSNNLRNFEILRVTKEYKYDFYPFEIDIKRQHD